MTASPTGFIGLVDGAQGLHPFTARKAVRIELVVDDPMVWPNMLMRRGVAAETGGKAVSFRDSGAYIFSIKK